MKFKNHMMFQDTYLMVFQMNENNWQTNGEGTGYVKSVTRDMNYYYKKLSDLLQKILQENILIIKEKYSFEEIQFHTWRALTKSMIESYGAEWVYGYVDESLAEISDRQNSGQLPKRIFNEEQSPRIIRSKGAKRKFIDEHFKITDIAKEHGLDVDRKGMCLCPFHPDLNTPSLSLSDEKNVFHCFGCGLSGDIVEFLRRINEVEHGEKGC